MNKIIDKKIEDYAIAHSSSPSALCEKLYHKTHELEELPQMLIGPMEASVLGFLIRSLGVRRVLEIGTFTGYSALAMAEQLPSDGEVITFDIETKYSRPEYQAIFSTSTHFNKIKFIEGNALEKMPTLKGQFDLIFIDADKVNYKHYFEQGLELLSSSGVIVIDNALWSGKVLKNNEEIDAQDLSTRALKDLNDAISLRTDLYKTLLPIRDGMFLVRKLL